MNGAGRLVADPAGAGNLDGLIDSLEEVQVAMQVELLLRAQ